MATALIGIGSISVVHALIWLGSLLTHLLTEPADGHPHLTEVLVKTIVAVGVTGLSLSLVLAGMQRRAAERRRAARHVRA